MLVTEISFEYMAFICLDYLRIKMDQYLKSN